MLYEQRRLRRRRFLTVLGSSPPAARSLVALGADPFPEVQPHVELIPHRRGGTVRPARRDPTGRRIQELQRSAGFQISIFARNLDDPRMLAVGADGTVYVTLRRPGQVVALQDSDADGRADRRRIVVDDLPDVHGICLQEEQVYLATVEEVYVCRIRANATLGPAELLIDDLPFGGRHPHRTIAFGPDEHLYVSVGSSGNCCKESNPEHATILRVSPNGTHRSVFARGLRNTMAFGWHPVTGAMWGMDCGSEGLGDQTPSEELNRLEEGKHYGWPYVYDRRKAIPTNAIGPEALRAFAELTVPPVFGYQAHAAPSAMAFYAGRQFPRAYHGDAFLTMYGSSRHDRPAGFEVVRLRFDRQGRPVEFQRFVTGFLIENGRAAFGRPTGLAVAADGSLLVSDELNGVIYRISYQAP